MQINDILLTAKNRGMRSGEIRITITNGLIRNAEYLVREWETKNVDGIVDNSKVNERTPYK